MKDFEWRYRRHRGTVAQECPRVAAMWHPTANSVSPEEVTCGSNRRIALICPKCGYGKNGEWRPSIAGACRTGGGCPVCSGKVLVEGVNDVATVHPEIAAQWHPTLNEFPPTRVTSGSARHVYLVCKDCGYGANGEWHPMIAFACGSGEVHTGCPECARNSLRKVMRAHYAKTARTCIRPAAAKISRSYAPHAGTAKTKTGRLRLLTFAGKAQSARFAVTS